ncbi:C6 zinc finger domain-containing protein [Ascosphaera apis ARSEF 7405]|uniref:C6 zinc finger domain-containing protein n=1 Tax=Ascosphaera apis ARSEF 7405 TaxID=392613 RepID=A0A168CBP5_9EURO|nr:C6 zinc finger domain-containing protein [Ascosphaera apis ARSEF 7405]
MANDPNRPPQYPLPSWSAAPPPPQEYQSAHAPPQEYHTAPVSQYPPPPQSAPSYQYPPPTTDMNGVPHPSRPPPPPHLQPPHIPDPYRLPPPPGPYQRPPVEYYGPPAPPVAPPQVVYQAAAPRQRTAIACRYCRRRKIRCSGFDSSADGRCSNCVRFNQECMFTPVSSQAQAFVPAQAAYPHLRSLNGIPPAQGPMPPAGRPAGRPAYAAEGVMLYGAYGQPLNTTLRGAPQPPPPAQHVQAPLPPQQAPAGPSSSHHTGAPLQQPPPPPPPPQSETTTIPPSQLPYTRPSSVPGPTTVAAIQVAYQPPPPPDQSSRKRPRPEDLHNVSQAASPQLSGASPPVQTPVAPQKARAAISSASAPPEQLQNDCGGANGSHTRSPPLQDQSHSDERSVQGPKSAPPASPHPVLPPPPGVEGHEYRAITTRPPYPPSSTVQVMTTSAPVSGHVSPAYAPSSYPQQQAYYPPPPPYHAGQPLSGQDGRPTYVYDQRGGPVNGHAFPPPHTTEMLNQPYQPTASLPMHPRPPHVYQQSAPPAHQYAPPPQHSQQQRQGPPSIPGQQPSSTQPTPQPPYVPSPPKTFGATISTTSQITSTGPTPANTSSTPISEHCHSQTHSPKEEKTRPRDSALPSGNSHTGATVTPPQQSQVPATLQPASRVTPTSVAGTVGGSGSGNSSGRGLSVLDLCGPDSNTAPTAKARSTTDSDMLNALSRKV